MVHSASVLEAEIWSTTAAETAHLTDNRQQQQAAALGQEELGTVTSVSS